MTSHHDESTVAAAAAAHLASTTAMAASQLATSTAQAASLLAELTRMDIAHIKADVTEIKTRLDNKVVTYESFEPIRKLVYGLVGLMLASVVLGILGLVLQRGSFGLVLLTTGLPILVAVTAERTSHYAARVIPSQRVSP